MHTAPYGTWKSSISGTYLAGKSVRLGETQWQGETLFWLASVPEEKGRQTIMCQTPGAVVKALLPAPWNARSRVHEYGGGTFCVGADSLYFVQFSDQQIYRLDRHTLEISAFSDQGTCRFADLHIDPAGQFLYAVCEDHSVSDNSPSNRIVRFALSSPHTMEFIDKNHDFVSNPRVSPDCQWLIHLCWNNPNMPWDESRLCLRKIEQDGTLNEPLYLTSGTDESVFQPQWRSNGDLFWVSDRDNWWNLRCASAAELVAAYNSRTCLSGHSIAPMQAEFATPQWVFGMSTYAFINKNEISATYTQNGFWYLCKLSDKDGAWQLEEIDSRCNSIKNVCANDGRIAFIGASSTTPEAVYSLIDGKLEALTECQLDFAEADIAKAQPFEFDTRDSQCLRAFGFYYPPTNSQYRGPDKGEPPIIVIGHGGPTGCGDPSFNFKIQYWTHRGFAVLDVNYRGSTGFGRQFRHALNYQWGLTDVQDLSLAAEYAVAQGWANSQQLIVKGSSAGGYSVLAALAFRDTFSAGVSLYGIADLELLVSDTHKFEARYLDRLVGPYPEERETYVQRSPIHSAHNINVPLLVFQGLQDKVVPPNQATAIVKSLSDKGIPVAHVEYPDEAHGFRGAKTICHQVEAELYFYQTIFSLTDAPSTTAAIEIKNWPTQ